MIMDMVVYISTFIEDDTFLQQFSCIRCKQLQSRRKRINRLKSASLLYMRLSDPLGLDFPEEIPFSFTYFGDQELYLEIANSLLGYQYTRYDPAMYYNNEKKIYMDYVTYGSFHAGLHTGEEYTIHRNKPLCAVYRLPLAKKRYLCRHSPIAKALIY